MGFGAETGTGFYRTREDDAPTAKDLAHLYHSDDVGKLTGIVDAFAEFIEQTEFTADRLFPFDYRDVFYWENRFPRWITVRMQEADLSHRVLLPFNQRGIIEAMLSMSFEDRVEKTLQHRFVDEYLRNEPRLSPEK
jgi:hypothetical protein